jgi:hypothetical protein
MKMKNALAACFTMVSLAGCCPVSDRRPMEFVHQPIYSEDGKPATGESPYTLVQTFDFGSGDDSDTIDTVDDAKVVEFSSPSEGDVQQPAVGSSYSDRASAPGAELREVNSRIDAVDEKLVDVLAMLTQIKDEQQNQLTETTLRSVLDEKLKVIIEWQDKQGKLSSTAAPIQKNGTVSAELPPGAVVVSMGGVPVSQYRAANPDASFPTTSTASPSLLSVSDVVNVSNVVRSGGSNGGSLSAPMTFPVSSAYVVSAPVSSGGSNGGSTSSAASAYRTVEQSRPATPVRNFLSSRFDGYESPNPSPSSTPVQAVSTSYYEIPGVTASVSEQPQATIVQMQVSDSAVVSSPGSDCYIDANGNRVCPQSASSSQQVSSQRRQPLSQPVQSALRMVPRLIDSIRRDERK